MNVARQALAQAAESLLGCPFRLHGRDGKIGIDCVGLVWAALAAIGRSIDLPADYSLRNLRIDRHLAKVDFSGFAEISNLALPGDIVLLRISAAQFHLGIIARSGGLIHAHVGLGRVVETPAPLPWPAQRSWRLIEQ